jgi:hypothetical protein
MMVVKLQVGYLLTELLEVVVLEQLEEVGQLDLLVVKVVLVKIIQL